MNADSTPGFPTNERKHVHNSYIWLGSLRAMGVLLFFLIVTSASSIVGLISEFGSDLESFSIGVFGIGLAGVAVIAAILLLFGAIVGIHAWAWKHLYYELGQEEFSLYSGIITKKRVHVPYQRIQSVDQRASLLQRIFGVCNLSIDTAGGSLNKAILVPYLTKSQADALRKELFARKQIAIAGPAARTDAQSGEGNILDVGETIWNEVGGVFAGDAIELEPVSYEYRLSNKELIFTGLSNNSGFAFALIVVIAVVAEFLGGALDVFPDAGDYLGNTVLSATEVFGLQAVIGVAFAGIIGIALVVWVVSIINACIQYGGFHARRRGSRIEVERGLLQHQTQSVSIDRIQTVVVKQSFIRKLIGYCELSFGKIDAHDSNEEKKQNSSLASDGIIVHPFLKVSRVNEVVAGLVPEYDALPDNDISLAKAALRRGLIRRCIWQGGGFWLIVCAVLAMIFVQFAFDSDLGFLEATEVANLNYFAMLFCYVAIGVGILITIVSAIGTVMWARNSAFAMNRHFMRVTNGGLSTESVTFLRSKIQYGFSKQNPLQRIAKTSTINARTAAGVGGTTISLIDVSQADAQAYLDWLKPRSQEQYL